jgi:hypothetical protein
MSDAPEPNAEHFRFAREDGCENLADDRRLATLAVCIAHQQRAGFKNYLDLRVVKCPRCDADGFNTGFGFWRFSCGAEILSDGTPGEPCPSQEAEAP